MKSNVLPTAFILSILFLMTLSCQDSSSRNSNETSPQRPRTSTWKSSFKKVAVDPSGNIYAVGFLAGTDTFDFDSSVTAAGPYAGENAVIVKYDPSGRALWAKTLSSGSDSSYFLGLTIDSAANIYTAGYIEGTNTFDFGNNVAATGTGDYTNAIIVKYDSSGTAQWARTASSDIYGNSVFYGIEVDQSDNIYAVGTISGTTFGFGDGVTATGRDINQYSVIAKYDPSGTALWAKALSSAPDNGSLAITVDPSDRVYTAGYIEGRGSLDWETGLTVEGSSFYDNTLIVKSDSSGGALWAKSLSSAPSSSYNHFRGLTSDKSEGIYAVGKIEEPGLYNVGDSVTTTVSSDNDIALIVKYASSGKALWMKTASSGPSYFSEVTADSSDNIYAAGSMTFDTLGFGNGVTATATFSANNLVIVKYDASGTTLWAKTTSSTSTEINTNDFSIGESELTGITVDNSDNIYAVGSIGSGIIDFGDNVIAKGISGYGNLVIVKYNSSGTVLWARTASFPPLLPDE